MYMNLIIGPPRWLYTTQHHVRIHLLLSSCTGTRDSPELLQRAQPHRQGQLPSHQNTAQLWHARVSQRHCSCESIYLITYTHCFVPLEGVRPSKLALRAITRIPDRLLKHSTVIYVFYVWFCLTKKLCLWFVLYILYCFFLPWLHFVYRLLKSRISTAQTLSKCVQHNTVHV